MSASLRDRLIDLRQRHGWSRAELGERIGVREKAVGHYETGSRYPGFAVLKKLAKLLGTDVGALYAETAGQPKRKAA